jgi:predicted transcriptional regulator
VEKRNHLKTLTLKLKEQEMAAIDAMAEKKGLTKTALIKRALRVFQAIDERIDRGEKLFLEDRNEGKAELLLL